MQAKTKRVKYVMTYTKENTNINEHRRAIVKLNNKNISKSAYRDRSTDAGTGMHNKKKFEKVPDLTQREFFYHRKTL